MRTALAQFEVIPGQAAKTLERVVDFTMAAKVKDAGIVAFPEMVFGYMQGDKWTEDEHCRHLMSFNEKIKQATNVSKEEAVEHLKKRDLLEKFNITQEDLDRPEKEHGIAAIWGNIYLDDKLNERVGDNNWHPNKDGRVRRYNAAYAAQRGEWADRAVETNLLPKGVQPKTLLPTYRFFDDQRYFFSLEDIAKDFGKELTHVAQAFGITAEDAEKYRRLPTTISKELEESISPIAKNLGLEPDQVREYIKDKFETTAIDLKVSLKQLAQPFVFNIEGQDRKTAVETCEDMWDEDYRMNGEAISMTQMLLENDAEVIVNISNSPCTYGKNRARDRRVLNNKNRVGNKFKPFHYVNCVGAQNDGKDIVPFDGGSTSYGTDGLPRVHASNPYEEELIIIDEEDMQGPPVPRVEKAGYARKVYAKHAGITLDSFPPIEPHEMRIAQKLDMIVVGMQHMKNMLGRTDDPKFINAMSGGIDSCTTSALGVIAYGRKKVAGITMPWVHTKKSILDNAYKCANALEIPLVETPIKELVEITRALVEKASQELGGPRYDRDKQTLIQLGNLASKGRTSVISNLAALTGAIYPNNACKNEAFISYFTLDGDGRGALAPIRSLTKFEEFQMDRFMNEKIFMKEVIPYALIPNDLCIWENQDQRPSAELEDDQFDPIKFGLHCAYINMAMDYKKHAATDFAQHFINGMLHKEVAARFEMPEQWGLQIMQRYGVDKPESFIVDIEGLLKANQGVAIAKRIQTQPGIITDKTDFGWDLREAIMPYEESEKFRELKTYIRSTMTRYEPKVAA